MSKLVGVPFKGVTSVMKQSVMQQGQREVVHSYLGRICSLHGHRLCFLDMWYQLLKHGFIIRCHRGPERNRTFHDLNLWNFLLMLENMETRKYTTNRYNFIVAIHVTTTLGWFSAEFYNAEVFNQSLGTKKVLGKTITFILLLQLYPWMYLVRVEYEFDAVLSSSSSSAIPPAAISSIAAKGSSEKDKWNLKLRLLS